MISLKDYLFRAPDSNIEFYVDTKKICQIILNLASQYGPNKVIVTKYLEKYGKIPSIKLPTIFPDILSENNACNFLFREILNEEIEKVNKFSTTKHEEIYREIMRVGKIIRSDITIPIGEFLKDYKIRKGKITELYNLKNSFLDKNKKLIKDMELLLNHLSNEVIHLDFYIRTNFKILTRLCRFFDIMLQSSTSVWFQIQLTKEPFVDVNIDILLILLSLSWSRYREAEKILNDIVELSERKIEIDVFNMIKSDINKKWKPPETFLRSTTKYWVHPNNVVSAKVGIIRYIPYLIFGLSNEELETLLDPYLCVEGHNVIDPKTIEESQAITSVYLDNESTECFYNRISRFEKAQLFRLRWYGSNSGSKDKEIFVERKTHHENWTGEKSAKERFSLPQKYVFNYLKGNITAEDLFKKGIFNKNSKNFNIEKNVEFAKEVQEYIVYNKLQPFLRTSYLRAAFQNQDNNEVRFSIDTNLCMVNEFIPDGHKSEPWCRLAEEVLSKNEVTRFPYAILEVKLQSEQPLWVSEMLKKCNATLVYKFSKFQHGMAILHENRVPMFPHWIEEFNKNNDFISSKSISELGEDDNDFDNYSRGGNQFYINKRNFYNDLLNTNRLSDMIVNSKNINSDTDLNINNKIILLIDKLMNSYLNMTAFDLHGLQIQWNRTVDEIEFSNISIDNNGNSSDLNTKKIKKLDPKSLFAAERVLLYWIRKSVYISTFVILLLSSKKNKIILKYDFIYKYIKYVEYSFIPLIIFTLIYGLNIYNVRCNTIQRKMVRSLESEKERIDYPKSSLVIFSILCSIMTLSLLLNIVNVIFS